MERPSYIYATQLLPALTDALHRHYHLCSSCASCASYVSCVSYVSSSSSSPSSSALRHFQFQIPNTSNAACLTILPKTTR